MSQNGPHLALTLVVWKICKSRTYSSYTVPHRKHFYCNK